MATGYWARASRSYSLSTPLEVTHIVHFAFCILNFAFCIVYCLLSTAYCLLPTASPSGTGAGLFSVGFPKLYLISIGVHDVNKFPKFRRFNFINNRHAVFL